MIGKIYFVSAPGRIKIGYTRQPEQRLSRLQSVDMEKLVSLGAVSGTRRLEASLHDKLAAYRIRGEWFVDCQEVRKVVECALAGDFAEVVTVNNDAPSKHPDCDPDFPMAVIRAAIRRCEQVTTQIKDRIGRQESVTDLVREVQFLAETIISPGLYGTKIKPEAHIGFDPPN